jgi:peptidoglycan/xylan/chitin deacetylase (PgdA/CDA1 family)
MAAIFKGPSERPLVALTIDDFPSSGADKPGAGSMALLDLLLELAIPSTLFAIGERVYNHPGMAARANQEGHELGNHMKRDEWSFTLGREPFLKQLDDTAEGIRSDLASTAQNVPLRWFRPSGGWYHPPMETWVRSRGYRLVMGSLWPLDGLAIAPPERAQRWFIQQFVHPGAIIVLHDTQAANPATLRTLQAVVPALQQAGFRFVTLSELLTQG